MHQGVSPVQSIRRTVLDITVQKMMDDTVEIETNDVDNYWFDWFLKMNQVQRMDQVLVQLTLACPVPVFES